MQAIKRAVLGTMAVAAIACAPSADAESHDFGHLHPRGLGRGLVGAVVGLATLPIAIAAAALSVTVPEVAYPSPGYDGPRNYAPSPGYYPAPQSYAPPYYAPPRAFYPRAQVYYAATRPYYAPRAHYAPRPGYYDGHASYRAGGYAYPPR